jgi:putative phosphoribosyl transferase
MEYRRSRGTCLRTDEVQAMPFENRSDAGRRLAQALARYRGDPVVVLALPRGGIPVAAEVARALSAPLDLVLVRKIGFPPQPELAMGAVVDGADPIIVRNEDVIRMARVSEAEFEEVCKQELAEIERRRARYLGSRAPIELEGRTAIVIDDGLATGATMRAALRALRKRAPRKIVLAVPVAPTDTLSDIRADADEVVCLEEYEFFGAIGAYYSDFRQVTDEELIATLARCGQPASAPTGGNAG